MMHRIISLFLILSTIYACSLPLLKEEDVIHFNTKVFQKQFIVRKDIYPQYNVGSEKKAILFKRGEQVHILLEEGTDWLKVRAFSVKEHKEQSQGKVILFIIREFLETKQEDTVYSLERLEKELFNLVQENTSINR